MKYESKFYRPDGAGQGHGGEREERNCYEDIIHLPYPAALRHPRMPLADRAAQFAPFAALAGHEEALRETARLTESFVEPDEGQREKLDRRLRLLTAQREENPLRETAVKVTYFRPDAVKDGGAYVSVTGIVRKVDRYQRQLVFADGTTLPMEKILSIEGEQFEDTD